jgi:hypothetical protein
MNNNKSNSENTQVTPNDSNTNVPFLTKTKRAKTKKDPLLSWIDRLDKTITVSLVMPTSDTAKKPKRGWSLMNAEDMNRQYPDTFYIEPDLARRSVEVEGVVKICLHCHNRGERFWVIVVSKTQPPEKLMYTGMVSSLPFETSRHGLQLGELIEFGKQHIFGIQVLDPKVKVVEAPTMS